MIQKERLPASTDQCTRNNRTRPEKSRRAVAPHAENKTQSDYPIVLPMYDMQRVAHFKFHPSL